MATPARGKFIVRNLGMTFDEALNAFLRSRKMGNGGANKVNSDRTVFEYRYDLTRFFSYFEGKSHYNEIDESDVLGFIEEWQSRDIATASKQKLLRSIRAFFHWVEKSSECKTTAMKSWNELLPKIGKTAGKLYVPTPDVMLKFLSSFNQRLIWGLRDFIVTSILIDCGPRIGEICNLTPESILWDQAKLLVTGKTGPRVVPVNAEITMPALKRWMREREHLAKSSALFVTKFGGKPTPNTFDQSFRDNRLRSGVGKTDEGTLTPHTVRHYFCTHYLVNGGTLAGLQAITGHTSLETLQIYLHMAKQFSFVAQEHASASPLQSLGKASVKKRKMF